MHPDKLLSQTIQFLRFPLMVAVVVIHTHIADIAIGGEQLTYASQYPFFDVLYHLLTGMLTRVAVPLFFFISGYLFFSQCTFSWQVYLRKLKSRVKTLLIPYIFWNAALCAMVLVAQLLFPSFLSGKNTLVLDYGVSEWVDVVFANVPMNPFWFIRDLIIMVVASPLIYAMLKYTRWVPLVLLGILAGLGVNLHTTAMGIEPLFYFMWGAYFSINKVNVAQYCLNKRYVFLALYVLLLVVDLYCWVNQPAYLLYAHKTSLIVGVLAFMAWAARGVATQKLKVNNTLTDAAFFLFCLHNPLTVFLSKLWVTFLAPMSDVKMIVGYLLIPLVVTIFLVCLYLLLRRYMPRFTAVITGGR